MPKYEGLVNIQWAITTDAADQTDAKEYIHQIVINALSNTRYQEISDESIEIDIREI